MLTYKGRALLLNNMNGKNIENISFMGIGKDNTPPSPEDQDLSDIKLIPTKVVIEVDQNQIVARSTFKKRDVEKAKEVGLFTDKKNLISRDLLDTSNLPNNTDIEISYILKITQDIAIENNIWQSKDRIKIIRLSEPVKYVRDDKGFIYAKGENHTNLKDRTYVQEGNFLYFKPFEGTGKIYINIGD